MVCVGVAVQRGMYQRKVDLDMLNAVKIKLADVSSVSAICSDERFLSCLSFVVKISSSVITTFFIVPHFALNRIYFS